MVYLFFRVLVRHNRARIQRLITTINRIKGFGSFLRLNRLLPPKNIYLRKTHNKTIVFISDRPIWREAKLAYGLHKVGWNVVLLHKKKPSFGDTSSFCELITYNSPLHALEIAHALKNRVYHNFIIDSDDTSVELLRNRPGKVVLDIYDYSYSHAFGSERLYKSADYDIYRQDFCLRNADAICARDLQLNFDSKKSERLKGKPTILFGDYCWNFQKSNSLCPKKNIVKGGVVQIGWVGSETRGEIDSGNFMVVSAIVEAGIDFHMYLHPFAPPLNSVKFRSLYSNYIDLAEKTRRVHFHKSVTPENLSQELLQYDWGLNAVNALCFDVPWTSTNLKRVSLCGSSRNADYLDADLGLILSRDAKYMYRTHQRLGVAIDMKAILESKSVHEVLNTKPKASVIASAREKQSILRNIQRLTDFYSALV